MSTPRGRLLSEETVRQLDSERAAVFDALAQRHLDSAYQIATLILRNSAEAEDATHDALLIAWQRWSSLRDTAKFEAWFSRILTNVCRDRLRRSRRRSVTDITPELRLADRGADLANAVATQDALNQAFDRLSADHRIVVVLRYYLDLQVDQIAERLGVPSGTVKSRLHHALREMGVTLVASEGERHD